MKRRSIKQQLLHVVNSHRSYGESKRAYKQSHDRKTGGKMFSVERADIMRDTAKQFAKFLETHYPGVKWVREIPKEAAQAYIDSNIKNWTNATAAEYRSRLHTLQTQINNTYNCNVCLETTLPERDTPDKIRDKAMEKSDLETIRADLASSRTMAKISIEITARCGLRVKEVARLRTDRIDLKNNVLHLKEGVKNGKYRDVPIRPKDREFFKELKEKTHYTYVTRGVSEDSLNKGIRRSLERCGLAGKYTKTTTHAIRKTYARERYLEELDRGKTTAQAWRIVQIELGHGKEYRPTLFETYIGEG